MDTVLFVSGHLTDDPDRTSPRFPDTRYAVDRVQDQLRSVLAAWQVGPGWTVVTGGARGADLLAAEIALERGAAVRLCLALEPADFLRRSVISSVPSPARDWPELFERVRRSSTIEVLPVSPSTVSAAGERSAFARANDWMLDVAEQGRELYGLLVWDGRSGTDGGTGAVVSRLDQAIERAERIHIIDPVPRAYAWRQCSPGPKRILSLDGGGLRGVITLEILLRMEDQLREHFDRPDLVLADFFDYIAGTSTGAIIASGLALGLPVARIRDRYLGLGRAAFRRGFWGLAQGARFRADAVQQQLLDFFDKDLVLGDPTLRALLLLVLHRTDTDSPWLLSNCTTAKYNSPDRLLPRNVHDRNLDLPLIELIRTSTAAPTYLPHQNIRIGGKLVPFQDGSVTAFNNPALIAAVMATVPAYGLMWVKGIDDLLVVSVGTGARAATAQRSRPNPVSALSSLTGLPSVFMNGSAFSQDLLCRAIGDCRYGPLLDSEVGALLGHQLLNDNDGVPVTGPVDHNDSGIPVTGEYFSFVRYDADLSGGSLREIGLPQKHWRAVRQMGNAGQIGNWQLIGQHASAVVDIADHFRGFLQLPEPAAG